MKLHCIVIWWQGNMFTKWGQSHAHPLPYYSCISSECCWSFLPAMIIFKGKYPLKDIWPCCCVVDVQEIIWVDDSFKWQCRKRNKESKMNLKLLFRLVLHQFCKKQMSVLTSPLRMWYVQGQLTTWKMREWMYDVMWMVTIWYNREQILKDIWH